MRTRFPTRRAIGTFTPHYKMSGSAPTLTTTEFFNESGTAEQWLDRAAMALEKAR